MLAEDIRAHGLRDPIVLYRGQILDGRNRLAACELAGVELRFVEYEGSDPIDYLVSVNLRRRNLDRSQRAMVAGRLANLRRGRPGRNASFEAISERQAAERCDVSRASVQRARDVLRRGVRALAEAVDARRLKVSAAAQLARVPPEQQQAAILRAAKTINAEKARVRREARLAIAESQANTAGPLPSRRYPVVLADPPWEHDGECAARGGVPVDYYPCMPLDEIAAMKIPATRDAILFLWAVSPMLPEALHVMTQWGFSYKAHFVWDKGRIGMGNWVRVQHELLLIGVRGNFPCPSPDARPSSVIREVRTEHSRKPEPAYELIERMYPTLPKVELFARRRRPGWDAWGNEIAPPEPRGPGGSDRGGGGAAVPCEVGVE